MAGAVLREMNMFIEHTVYMFSMCMCADMCSSADILKGNSNILESLGEIAPQTVKVTLQEGQILISFCCFGCVYVCLPKAHLLK